MEEKNEKVQKNDGKEENQKRKTEKRKVRKIMTVEKIIEKNGRREK